MIVKQDITLDLTKQGSYQDIDVSQIDAVSVAAFNADLWSSGVVEIVKVVGNQEIAFSPAAELSSSTGVKENLSISSIEYLRARVKTSYSSGTHAHIRVFGKQVEVA